MSNPDSEPVASPKSERRRRIWKDKTDRSMRRRAGILAIIIGVPIPILLGFPRDTAIIAGVAVTLAVFYICDYFMRQRRAGHATAAQENAQRE